MQINKNHSSAHHMSNIGINGDRSSTSKNYCHYLTIKKKKIIINFRQIIANNNQNKPNKKNVVFQLHKLLFKFS